MRFAVNQLLFAVHFGHTDRLGGYGHYFTPLLLNDVQPTDINFVLLEVTEHHKVPNEWDTKGDLDCDGFILKDDQGRLYHNQYPRASYGQTSDEGDRRFDRAAETREEFLKLEAEGPKTVYSYHLLDDVLWSLERSIKDLGEIAETGKRYAQAKAKREQLVVLRDRIFKEFEEKFPEYKISTVWREAFKISTVWREAFKKSDLIWPEANIYMFASVDKIKEKTKEELVKIVNSFERIEAELPGNTDAKDRIGIQKLEGIYYINNKLVDVDSLDVMYLEHTHDYSEDEKPVFYVRNSDMFPTDWTETAVDCFMARLNDTEGRGFKATNTGMSPEQIHARDKAPEGVVVVKSEGRTS